MLRTTLPSASRAARLALAGALIAIACHHENDRPLTPANGTTGVNPSDNLGGGTEASGAPGIAAPTDTTSANAPADPFHSRLNTDQAQPDSPSGSRGSVPNGTGSIPPPSNPGPTPGPVNPGAPGGPH